MTRRNEVTTTFRRIATANANSFGKDMTKKEQHAATWRWGEVLTRAMTLATLCVPILFLVGLAFDQGYQSTFNVPVVARSSGFHETLTLGFFAVHHAVRMLRQWMSNHWSLMLSYALVAGALAAFLFFKRESWTRSIRARILAWARAHKVATNSAASAGVSVFVFLMPYLLIAIFYTLLTMPLLGYLVGNRVARTHLGKHAPTCELAAAHPDRFFPCVTAKNSHETVSGYLIAATSTHFVIAINGRTRAIPLDGWEFESTYYSVNSIESTSAR